MSRPDHEDAADPFRLRRFVDAQNRSGSYLAAVAELRNGRKVGHWMWYVFPQIAGLGRSATSQTFGISSLAEARAYLAHDILGPRLRGCAEVLAGLHGRTATQVLGETDAMKLRSSMTLFARAAPDEPAFREVLDRYFDGVGDTATEQRL